MKPLRRSRWQGRKRHWSLRLIWEQWALPLSIWWWPIEKDRAIGVSVGPVHLHWEKHPRG